MLIVASWVIRARWWEIRRYILEFKAGCFFLIHIFDSFSLKRVTDEFTKSVGQRNPWSVFRKPLFFHTFSVIWILSNYRKCMGKPRFSKNWSQTSLHSRFSVFFLWTRNLLFSKREREIIKYMNSGRNSWLWVLIQIFKFPGILHWLPWCNFERELLSSWIVGMWCFCAMVT